MEAAAKAVLDLYHQRIREESQAFRGGGQPGGRTFSRDDVLLAVGPETGQLLHILASSKKAPNILEIGTSYGYSGIWLADAARISGGRLTTLELQDYKSAHAKEMSEKAGLAAYVDFKVGDALALIDALPGPFDFILLDLWKDLYVPCLEAVYPKLSKGAIIVADNMIRPGGDDIRRYADAVKAKPDLRSILLPVGSGIEISVYEPA